ncbi:CWF19-like protein 2 [Tanacetum coccineum]
MFGNVAKWYSSEEDDDDSASYSDSGSEEDTRKGKESKKRHKSKKSRRRGKSKRRQYSSDESDDENDDKKKKGKGRSEKSDIDGNGGSVSDNENIVRKEMGLEWMLRPKEEGVKPKSVPASSLPEEPPANEIKKVNPRELNPYFRNDGRGYPEEEADGEKSRDSNLLSSSVVGDRGASWRLKAMKHSQEQAAREGKNLDEVVKERWGSLGKLAFSVASNSAAPSHAHLHAIKDRLRQ